MRPPGGLPEDSVIATEKTEFKWTKFARGMWSEQGKDGPGSDVQLILKGPAGPGRLELPTLGLEGKLSRHQVAPLNLN
jgi:hypothetical protein